MKPVLILYATREGHTRRIAEHIAATVRARGVEAQVVDASHLPQGFSLDAYASALIAASVHQSAHEKEIVDFVKRHRAELERIPAVFLSVSLSEAGAEDRAAPPERRAQAAADVKKMIDTFLAETGWHPSKVRAAAGALMYSNTISSSGSS
jgi:menaquinone-dependent protoporphyrinogen oxidase